MEAGEIYWVNLDPAIGSEIKKKRPVIVLNGGHKKHLKLAIVAPLTAWNSRWKNHPFFVPIEPDKNNQLEKKSVVDCFQIRAISHQRFAEKIGIIPEEKIHLIKQALSLILDIEPEHCG